MSVRSSLALSVVLAALPAGAIACSGSLHIELEHPGVYALDHAGIVKAEPALADCPRDTLVLTQNGKEVPIRVTGAGTSTMRACWPAAARPRTCRAASTWNRRI